MPAEPFLHDHKDFKSLLMIVSDKLNIVPQLIEKDYWIMHCLWGMQQQQDLSFELKGGTSLSKGFGVIDRFSEDIDIRIEPPAAMKVMCRKNHDKASHVESRRNFFEWVKNTIKIPGIAPAVRDTDHDDQECRSGGIRLHYRSDFSPLQGIKDGVLLEIGFDDTAPNQAVTISSWAYDHAASMAVPCLDTRAIDVKCYRMEFTFVEKLQAVSTKFRKQQENGRFETNFLRHYYDIYKLLERTEVQQYIGTSNYEERKERRFPASDNRKIKENEAFLLSDPATRKLYAEEYQKTKTLYYKGQVPFDEILDRIAQHIDRL